MKKRTKRGLAILLVMSLCIGGISMQSRDAEAGIFSWVVKKVAKNVVTKVVTNTYKKKQQSFKVKQKNYKIRIKGTVKLKPLLCYGNTIFWSTSNSRVASVSSKGIVKGKKAGTAIITAQTSISRQTTKIKITVKPYKTIKKNLTLTVGKKDYDDYGEDAKVTSSKPGCVDAWYDETAALVRYKAKKVGKSKVTIIKKNLQKVIVTVKVKKKAVTATAKPTTKPTTKPTAQPIATMEPTIAPTIEPTVEPTVEPSVLPEPTPTLEPSASPDVTPVPEATSAVDNE